MLLDIKIYLCIWPLCVLNKKTVNCQQRPFLTFQFLQSVIFENSFHRVCTLFIPSARRFFKYCYQYFHSKLRKLFKSQYIRTCREIFFSTCLQPIPNFSYSIIVSKQNLYFSYSIIVSKQNLYYFRICQSWKGKVYKE